MAGAAAAGPPPPEVPTDDLGYPVELARPTRRVVSLVPSLTESVAVTRPEALVGATIWCTHPPGLDVPRVRGTKNPDLAAIRELRPDIVLANKEENRRLDVDRLRAAGVPVWVTDIRTLDAAFRSLRRMFTEALGWPEPPWLSEAEAAWAEPAAPTPAGRGPAGRESAGRGPAGRELGRREPAGREEIGLESAGCAAPWDERAAGERAAPVSAGRGPAGRGSAGRGAAAGTPVRAVIPIWRDPWMVVGSGTFTGDLAARLGLENVYADHPERYPHATLDDMAARRPALIVLPDEPYPFSPEDGPEAFTAPEFPGARIALVAGRSLTWYGPSLITARSALLAQLSPLPQTPQTPQTMPNP